MTPTWTIRTADSTDAAALQRCMVSAFSVYGERLGGERLPPMDADYSLEIRHYPTWVAESGGTVCAGMILSFENDRASIASVAVAPEWQGLGIGKALLEHAESMAEENGFSALHLATHLRLHENLALYRRLGWKETGRDGSRVFLKKPIAPNREH